MGTIREYKRDDGSVTYHAEVRLRGHPPERDSFRTKSLAKKWIQDTESAIRDGRHSQTSEAKRHTVGELIDRFITQWLAKYPERRKKQAALLDWWKRRIGHLSLSDLRAPLIAEARDALLIEPNTRGGIKNPSTVNRYLAAFSKALTIAVKEWGWLDDSPMRKVEKPQEGKGRDRFLSLDEKDRFLNACKASSNSHLYSIVSLAILTGMRFSEIMKLSKRDLDFEQKIITLQKTKNGERRYIPITAQVEAILNEYISIQMKDDELIFKSVRPNNKRGVITIRKAFEKALEVAQIQGFRFHDLRHTSASYLAMNGATQGELMAILGHKTPAMTRRYAHYSQKHLASLLERTNLKMFTDTQELI